MRRNIFIFSNNSFAKFVPLLIGFMIFLATIFIALGQVIKNVGDKWSDGIDNSLIVQVVKNENLDSQTNQDILNRTITILNQTRGIKKATLVSTDDTLDMLSPWLGNNIRDLDLPIPYLIQVERNSNYTINIKQLKDQLEQISQNILLDDFAFWREKITNTVSNINNFVYGLIFLILVSTVILLITLTRGLMLINTNTLNMLILMGATDKFIVRDFVFGAVRLIFKTSFFGFILGATFVNLLFFINEFNAEISPIMWAGIFVVVPFVYMVGFVSSSLTVLITLGRRFFKINF